MKEAKASVPDLRMPDCTRCGRAVEIDDGCHEVIGCDHSYFVCERCGIEWDLDGGDPYYRKQPTIEGELAWKPITEFYDSEPYKHPNFGTIERPEARKIHGVIELRGCIDIKPPQERTYGKLFRLPYGFYVAETDEILYLLDVFHGEKLFAKFDDHGSFQLWPKETKNGESGRYTMSGIAVRASAESRV